MIGERVYAHGFDALWRDKFRPVCERLGLELVDTLPAGVAVINGAGDEKCVLQAASFADEQGLLHTPVIVAGGPDWPDGYEAAAQHGLQGYVASDDAEKVAATARMVLDTVRRYSAVHPLTGLPGSPALEREISERIGQRGELAVVQFDIDNFKPYNDVYGYRRGDEVIAWLGRLIVEAIAENATGQAFVAHLGGDDFVAAASVNDAREIGEAVVATFDAGREVFFDEAALQIGHFSATSRRGERQEYPLFSLTAVMVTNEADDIVHPGHISSVLAEMKRYVKGMAGSNFYADRRKMHWSDTPRIQKIAKRKL